MITKEELLKLASLRLGDSNVLLLNKRYQGSIYIGGYVIELLLKYNICKIFNLTEGFPENEIDLNSYNSIIRKEFKDNTKRIGLKTYKTHNLSNLLLISGKEYEVKNFLLNEWTEILIWNPEMRYKNFKIEKKVQ